MTTENFKNYVKAQKINPQWAKVLRAMASEMSSVSEVPDLRDFFYRIGEQFAATTGETFAGVETLDDLESSLNSFWVDMTWGWVELVEDDEGINIAHQCSPLAQAFGEDALSWSVGFLEGFYHTLFTEFGASDDMVMNCVSASLDGMDIRLRFSQS
jgi:predicted hydrocarbon binding protein